MKNYKYIIGMFVGVVIALFHLVFKTDISENFAFFGLGVALCSAAFHIHKQFTNEDYF